MNKIKTSKELTNIIVDFIVTICINELEDYQNTKSKNLSDNIINDIIFTEGKLFGTVHTCKKIIKALKELNK